MTDSAPFTWSRVVTYLREQLPVWQKDKLLDEGQVASLRWACKGLPHHGLIIADEVGTGKTRIACAIIASVVACRGRVAVVVPRGLMHQWQREAKPFFAEPCPAYEVTTYDAAIAGDPVDDAAAPQTRQQKKWMLVSQRFGVPRLRSGDRPNEQRVGLISQVRALLSPRDEREDQRTGAGRNLGSDEERNKRAADLHRFAQEICGQIKGAGQQQTWRKRLEHLPWFQKQGSTSNDELVKTLQGEEGQQILHELLGWWLSDVDLVIVDEAHKSRDVVGSGQQGPDRAKKTLPRLLDDLLRKESAHQRRICLTATPMEMNLAEDWGQLIQRAEIADKNGSIRDAISEFSAAITQARITPDETPVLDKLERCAKEFARQLRDFVSRRRRSADKVIQKFSDSLPERKRLAHPHRRAGGSDDIKVVPCDSDSRWNEAIFVSECLRESQFGGEQSPDGSRRNHHFAQHVVAGRVMDLPDDMNDIADGDGEKIADDDVHLRKRERIAYWNQQFRSCVRESGPTDSGHHDHPRFLAAARCIEEWTKRGEKVLVFGVFTQPMERLRDVLNVRNALDLLRDGRPLPRKLTNQHRPLIDQQRAIVARQEPDRWADLLDGEELMRLARKAHIKYEALQRMVRKKITKSDLGASRCVADNDQRSKSLERDLVRYFRTYVLGELCSRPTVTDVDSVTDEMLEAVKSDFCENLLPTLLGQSQDPQSDSGEDLPDVEQRWGADLMEALQQESAQVSDHVRLLRGDTPRETRIILQSAFNHAASPQVLIAQSMIGREGLNLQKRCRIVVQFHLEWNPGVIEQQIGRVDRKGSRWEKMANDWMNTNVEERTSPPPFIEVVPVILEGTYDESQWQRFKKRKADFEATLFGSLLPAETWRRIPESRQASLRQANIDFSPSECSALLRPEASIPTL